MRGALVLTFALLSTPVAAQRDIPRQRQLRTIAETYRAGNTEAALKTLATDNTDTQRRTAEEVLASNRIGTIHPPEAAPGWSTALLRAAGAVHMEQALALYKRGGRNLAETVITQIQIGELLLDEVAALEKRESDAVGWEWAIGQQAMSDGAFGHVARTILLRACDRYPDQPILLLGCGTLYESLASNSDTGLALDIINTPSELTRIADSALSRFRSNRNDNLKLAAEAFAEVRRLDPPNVEAALRLGKVPAAAAGSRRGRGNPRNRCRGTIGLARDVPVPPVSRPGARAAGSR